MDGNMVAEAMIVTRFAPSPTGLLHLGHAYAALMAAAAGERFLLRIEDIDTTRCRPEFEAAIFEDLAWLGLSWEEPVLRQSERFGAYRAALNRLDGQGLLYPCFCSRAEIAAEIARAIEAPHGPEDAHYPGTCKRLSPAERALRMERGDPYTLRLDVKRARIGLIDMSFREYGNNPGGDAQRIEVGGGFLEHAGQGLLSDIVLARKDVPASYHLAAVVDDAFQGVTLVTRGRDLLPATHVQRILQARLELPVPVYAHHDLILGKDGRKFSKRDNAVTLRALRESGATPRQIREWVGFASHSSQP
jgi:glutamyl-Q tRNA(Asp) synthetase